MAYLTQFIDYFLHLDKYLPQLIAYCGAWTHTILFLVVFCETGLVITPFLPGDSLLFAAGAAASLPDSPLKIPVLVLLLIVAAIGGDALNYHIGKIIGPRAFSQENNRFFKKEYLERTQRFYEKYGGKTIIIARFVPIIRTFAPFLAGIGTMSYPRFALYNITGGVAWVLSFTLAGYFFGGLNIVKSNFSLVILVIIILSVLPAVIEVLRARKESALAADKSA